MKNKFTSLILLICITLCLPVTSYAVNNQEMEINLFKVSGRGTEANPFRITNEEELLLLADFPECYFELENDIEFTGTWEPVADFSGSLDGKGHTITVSDYMLKTNMGFFGTLSGTVKNLTINANSLSEERSYDTYIGLFAGKCTGTIENCKAKGSFTFKWSFSSSSSYDRYMGGFCGELSGSIKNSLAQFDLYSYSSSYSGNVGGICGNLTGTIEQCANMSSVVMGYGSYGGISGYVQSDALIKDSMNLETSIKHTSSNKYYAGISDNNHGTIENCYSAGGDGNAWTAVYGIAYNATGGTMTNCYYDKVVLGNSNTSYGTPKSTLAMKMEATYKNWDFENVWAIDESEENPINDGYPYLKAFYEDVETPVTISSLSAENGKLVIDTKITDVSDNYTLHIALYDNQNKLCGYMAIPNERQLKDVFVVYPDDENAAYAKIFTWYSTDNIEPVSTCETVTIER